MFKFIGGVLLVIGVVFGASLLALPIVMGSLGFIGASIVLCCAWFIMTVGALYILEATQWLPQGANFISLTKNLLNKKIAAAVWFIYALLKYAVISAYISGASDLISFFLKSINIDISQNLTALIFVIIMGIIVYRGIHNIDIINRFLMIIKFSLLFMLIGICITYVRPANLIISNTPPKMIIVSITVAFTSFGFAAIVPSLYRYFDGNAKRVQTVIVIGTVVPLILYITWNLVIIGMLSTDTISNIYNSGNTLSKLTEVLQLKTESLLINPIFKVFSTVCILTSFLGISIAFIDFLIDGFNIEENRKTKLFICLIAFVPSTIVVYVKPDIFIEALTCAGILVMILLVLLPSLMVYSGRTYKKYNGEYKVFGGKVLIVIMLSVSIILIINNFINLLIK